MTEILDAHSTAVRIRDIREATFGAIERDALLAQKDSPSSNSIQDLLARLRSTASTTEEDQVLRHIGPMAANCDALSREHIRAEVIAILRDHRRPAPARVANAVLAPRSKMEANGGLPLVDTVAPCELHVDGGSVLTELAATYRRYAVLPSGAADALALWCMHTYVFDRFMTTPRIVLTSPTKRCGKTTVLDLLGATCQRPLQAANLTAAVTFRSIEAAHPTLLIDEADTFLREENGALRGILNSGHRKGGRVLRSHGDAHEPRAFDVFAPVAIAAIGRMPDTVMDRSIVISMRRRLRDEHVARFRWDRLKALSELACRCARWAEDYGPSLNLDPEMPDALHDRAADNWRSLISIADLAGGEWPDLARRAALGLAAAGVEDESRRVILLADIRTVFDERDESRLPTPLLLAELHSMDDRPWGEWSHGAPMTPQALGRQLGGFGIAAAKWRDGTVTVRGYERRQFLDAWERYR